MAQTNHLTLASSSLSIDYLSGLLGASVTSIEPVDGGSNSRVFKVTGQDGSVYVAKMYPGPTADGQDRMTIEFDALEYLCQRGVDCVPQPVVSDPSRQCALYEFVEGSKIDSSEATTAEVDQASRFLHRINELKSEPEAGQLPNAAEACFSMQQIVSNLESRLGQLQTVDSSSPLSEEFQEFLGMDFIPVFKGTTEWSGDRVTKAGMSMDSELGREDRTLSPSDFGFHNCLRRSDGRLIFLDFEYFGWDDPAKMICDFLLHPAMDLSNSLKRRFVNNLVSKPNLDQVLLERIETAYPLFGLKWCLILLNPFLAQYRLQRGIDDLPEKKQNGLLERQLEKAKLMLSKVRSGCEQFPYWDERYACNVN